MSHELDTLAFDFFKLFAQYESTLKERGHFQVENSGAIKVKWDRFANEVVGSSFLEQDAEIQEHLNYILNEPPKKQGVNETNQIIWIEVSNTDKSVQALFGHICRMRNNLFHGAKFNGTWFDPERSEKLLKSGLIVLKYYKNKYNFC